MKKYCGHCGHSKTAFTEPGETKPFASNPENLYKVMLQSMHELTGISNQLSRLDMPLISVDHQSGFHAMEQAKKLPELIRNVKKQVEDYKEHIIHRNPKVPDDKKDIHIQQLKRIEQEELHNYEALRNKRLQRLQEFAPEQKKRKRPRLKSLLPI
jgi:hypothetical protein